MDSWVLILIIPIYIIFYALSSFLSTYKIYLVSNNKNYLAAFVSAMGLFIMFSLYAFVPYFALVLPHWWLSLILVVVLAFSTFFSNFIVSKVDKAHQRREDKNKIKKEGN